MISKGDRLENPITGETLIFRRTSEETGGEAVVVETIVRPNGFVAAAHVHPYQSERFEILEGLLRLRMRADERLAGPGDVVTVAAGTPHRFWNAGEGNVRFLCEVRPALGFESLIETMFTLAARWQDEPERAAQSASPGSDRQRPLRHGPPSVPACMGPEGRPHVRGAARTTAQVRVDIRPR
jgi:quercetin dioxygenase-like cupin family protein